MKVGISWCFNISKVDEDFVAESSGQTGVFINNSKTDFSILRNGDCITIGGVKRTRDGFKGPFVEYKFVEGTSEISDPENVYSRPAVDPGELITLNEIVNGVEVEEVYSSHDFEETRFDVKLSNYQEVEEMPRAGGNRRRGRAKPSAPSKAAVSTNENSVPDNNEVVPSTSKNMTSASCKLPLSKTKEASTSKGTTSSGQTTPLTKKDTNLNEEDDEWAKFERSYQKATAALKRKELKQQGGAKGGDKETPKQAECDTPESEGSRRKSGRAVKRPVKYVEDVASEDEDKVKSVIEAKKPNTGSPDKNWAPTTEDKQLLEDDEDQYQDFDEVSIDISKKEIELPDISCEEEVQVVREVPGPSSLPDKKYQTKLSFKSGLGDDKKKAPKGKGKKFKGQKVKRSLEDDDRIKLWQRPPYVEQAPEWVEVLRGAYRGVLFNFSNRELFKVTFLNNQPGDREPQVWNSNEYNISLKIDVNNLRFKLLTGDLPMDDYDRIFRVIRKNMPYPEMTDFDKSCVLPNDYTVAQPTQIKVDLKQYQLNAMAWMKRLEDRVDREWTMSKLVEWEQSEMDLMFDVNEKVVYMPPIPRAKSTILGVKAKGGIYADQMGLGKTITLLSLFCMNPSDAPKIPLPRKVQQQDQFYLETGATLVVAPSHLTGQWRDEVQQHTEEMKVIVITTKPQYDKVSYIDILEADLVIVSVQFLLSNKAFTEKPKGIQGRIEFMRLMMKPGINPLLETSPNLCHFMWWRIVADEAHELLTYEDKHQRSASTVTQPSPGLETVGKIMSRHRWYVTGTPFPHGAKSLRAALKFVEMEVDDQSLVHPDGSLKVDQGSNRHTEDFNNCGLYVAPLYNIVRNNFYVRNTKDSVGLEYDVPEFIEELILLTMSPVERGVYDRTVNLIERRKLCCHLQIAARIQCVAGAQQKSLEEVRAALIDHNEKEIRRIKDLITKCEEDIKKEKKEYAAEDNPNGRRLINARITRLKESVTNHQEDLNKANNALSYFQSIVPRIEHSADEPCVICLENITDLTVTPCGHMFCHNCIVQCIHQQGLCPTCRQNINESGLIQVKDPNMRTELVKSEELRRLTEKYGTKMAYLIFYLRNLFESNAEARVIIFSQWDSLLHKIGDTLRDNNITNVFVKGNVHVRNKAIMSFRRQAKTRVIMLSLQNAASGTNLVEATHVILIDPVAGSKEEAIAIETQAIGRAHRMGQYKQISVVRMIMKDTMEHELYMRNKSDDVQQIEFNFENTNRFGGPQIIRTQHHIAEPDPAVLRTALQNIVGENDEPSTSTVRRRTGGGGRRFGGAVRGGRFGGFFGRRRPGMHFPYHGDSDEFQESDSDAESGNCIIT